MNDWNPSDLQHCVDSPLLGWLTGGLACGMLVWYAMIATRWWEASRLASPEGCKVWQWLVIIFVICAMAGYGSWILALFAPKTAVWTRVLFLTAQNLACPMFWKYATHRRFTSIGRFESIGEQITKAVTEPDRMDDRELASLARQMVAKSLERYSDSVVEGL